MGLDLRENSCAEGKTAAYISETPVLEGWQHALFKIWCLVCH
jgi:hypothetical protein